VADPARPGSARLAVVIPAYGRGETIAATLTALIDEARAGGLDVDFLVSDDTPDASVEDAVRGLGAPDRLVRYRRNTPALRHDRNLISSLLWPDARHVWLLGSGQRPPPGILARVAAFLDDQDLLLVESHSGDRRMLPALRGAAARDLLRDALWHQTMTGTTVYGRRVLDWARERGQSLRVMPNFPQISVMAGYASEHDATVGWFGEPSLTSAGSGEISYWRARAVDVFALDWADAVEAFPGLVPPDRQAEVIRAHSRRAGLFNTVTLTACRRSGQFRWSSLRDRRFRRAMHEPMWKLLAILTLPVALTERAMAMLTRVKTTRP